MSDKIGQDGMGNVSDGYHTFNELYGHRNTLFSVLSSVFWQLSWKTRKDKDGNEIEGWFIAGIETPVGQVTYHLPDEYWHKISVVEIERNENFDGHDSFDVIERLPSLKQVLPNRTTQHDAIWYLRRLLSDLHHAIPTPDGIRHNLTYHDDEDQLVLSVYSDGIWYNFGVDDTVGQIGENTLNAIVDVIRNREEQHASP